MDISDSSVKVVQLKKRRKNIDLVSWGKVKLEAGVVSGGRVKNEKALASAIRYLMEVVKGKKIKKRYVSISLPEEKSFFQTINIPQMEGKQIKEVIGYEAENCIPLPVDDVYLDFDELSSNAKGLDVLVAALPKKVVDSRVSSIEKAGLFPVVAETESMAIARSVVKEEDRSKSLLLIDIGESKTSIIALHSGKVIFSSYILTSSGEFTEKIADFCGVSTVEAERLKKEHGIEKEKIREAVGPLLEETVDVIKKQLHYYEFCGLIPRGIEKIIVCGGGSGLRGLTAFMSDKLYLPIEKGDPLINVSKRSQNKFDEEGLNYGVAIGLALRNFS